MSVRPPLLSADEPQCVQKHLLSQVEKETRGRVPASRLWTTLLVCAHLETRNEHFVIEEPDSLSDVGTTLLDNARLWLQEACRVSPRLRQGYDGLAAAARAQARAWEVRSTAVAAQLRTHETSSGRSSASAAGVGLLIASRMFKAVVEAHEMLGVVFARSDEALPKHQACVVRERQKHT